MFVGHVAVGFASKRAAPKTSVGTLLLAAMLIDVLFWSFVLAGIEHLKIQPGITTTNALNLYDFAWSHSLLMCAVWGAVMAGMYFALRKRHRGALVVFAVVMSHWVLDWISHRPDMALAPGVHSYFGLGLYNSRIGIFLVEGGLWIVGIIMYERSTHSRKRTGVWALYTGVLILTLLWLPSLSGAAPGVSIITMGKIDMVFFAVFFAWAYWTDSLRVTTPSDGDATDIASQAQSAS